MAIFYLEVTHNNPNNYTRNEVRYGAQMVVLSKRERQKKNPEVDHFKIFFSNLKDYNTL